MFANVGWLVFAFGDAGGAGAADANAGGPSITSLLLPFAIMFGAFYFLILLPENRRNKQKQEQLSKVKKGDEVLTTGGIIGIVANVKDNDRITIKVDDKTGVTIEFAKTAIAQILKTKGGDNAANAS